MQRTINSLPPVTENESKLAGRLMLLKEVAKLSNPRFGVDRMMNSFMRLLREYYGAEGCLLVSVETDSGRFMLRRSSAKHPDGGLREDTGPEIVSQYLTNIPPDYAVVYGADERGCLIYDLKAMESENPASEFGETMGWVANLLGADAFISVPVSYDKRSGRLYLSAGAMMTLNDPDPEFLYQLIGQVMPYLNNIKLVDRLASSAAEQERQRIARDIHDSVIQPYLGLQFGLEAVRQKLLAGDEGALADVDRLLQMTQSEVSDLRSYMQNLKTGARTTGREGCFLPAVRRFAAKFAETTKIKVEVKINGVVTINDRLAAEAFQIVAEGLSNIRRHTVAESAVVSVGCDDTCFTLRIENDGGPPPGGFFPKSITERAAALGGLAQVDDAAGGVTAVTVTIPL